MLKMHPLHLLICHFAITFKDELFPDFKKSVLHLLSSALDEAFQALLFCFHTAI